MRHGGSRAQEVLRHGGLAGNGSISLIPDSVKLGKLILSLILKRDTVTEKVTGRKVFHLRPYVVHVETPRCYLFFLVSWNSSNVSKGQRASHRQPLFDPLAQIIAALSHRTEVLGCRCPAHAIGFAHIQTRLDRPLHTCVVPLIIEGNQDRRGAGARYLILELLPASRPHSYRTAEPRTVNVTLHRLLHDQGTNRSFYQHQRTIPRDPI